MFNKGDVVELIGYEKSYRVMVHKQCGQKTFAGMIIQSEFEDDKELSVGEYSKHFMNIQFKIVKVNDND